VKKLSEGKALADELFGEDTGHLTRSRIWSITGPHDGLIVNHVLSVQNGLDWLSSCASVARIREDVGDHVTSSQSK
ncbi:unnamed protein product, partial [Durusdinium trenchii]